MERSQPERTLAAETHEQALMVSEAITPHLLWTPVPLKASTFFVNRFSGSDEKFSTCKMTIYGTQQSVGPFDESSVISLLFPQHSKNSGTVTTFYDHNEWSEVPFAEMSEFHRPSMAVYSDNLPLEIFWIGRVYYHNPQYPYDYQVHVALLN